MFKVITPIAFIISSVSASTKGWQKDEYINHYDEDYDIDRDNHRYHDEYRPNYNPKDYGSYNKGWKQDDYNPRKYEYSAIQGAQQQQEADNSESKLFSVLNWIWEWANQGRDSEAENTDNNHGYVEQAIAIMKVPGGSGVDGIVTFDRIDNDKLRITANITGLSPGPHGWHIHEFGDLSDGCTSIGGHYNPTNVDHGGQDSVVRHVGDLGNIVANEYGNAYIQVIDEIIKLDGEYAVIGRAIDVHANEDDLGLADNEKSLINGNAGPRVACGVIGHRQQEDISHN